MKELVKKYKEDKLSPEELDKLKQFVNNASEQQIQDMMYEDWLDNSYFESKDIASEDQLDTILMKVNRNIAKAKPKSRFSLKRIAFIAASVFIPILFVSTFYMYLELQNLQTQEMVVSTVKGEKARVTLPDGTEVVLNSESTLKYTPQTYNKKERNVKFEGEAYFDVMKQDKNPFTITSDELTTKVLGTKFNLQVRENSEIAELALQEGSVLLASQKEEKELQANQRAVIHRLTGEIIVVFDDRAKYASNWKTNKLVFKNARLEDVLNSLKINYGVTITMKANTNLRDDLFSGVLVANDLVQALEVIKLSYHLNYSLVENHVVFKE